MARTVRLADRMRLARGFTLLEMLVTLMVVALASTLIWQALAQLARVELRLAQNELFAEKDALRREWVRLALYGVQSGPTGDPHVFRGEPLRLSALTGQPPWTGELGLAPIELTIERDGEEGAQLVARRIPDGPRIVLLRWKGEGAFLYLDWDGHWRDRWPPFLSEPDAGLPLPRLPRAIHLTGPPGGGILVALPATDNPMLRRADVES